MYCINCGVKLADSEKVCPLCETKVYHPELPVRFTQPPFPAVNTQRERISRKGSAFILSIIFILRQDFRPKSVISANIHLHSIITNNRLQSFAHIRSTSFGKSQT